MILFQPIYRTSDNKISEGRAQANMLVSQLTVVTREDWAGHSLKEMEAKSASLKRDHQVITEKYKLLEERITGTPVADRHS